MGTRQRRDREKSERRRKILAAAKDVFWKQGYAAATVPQLAAAAELAPGTLYLYFPSKDALYAELLAEGYELLHERLEKSVRPGAAPRRQAEALIDAFIAFARAHPEYFDIMFFVLQREGSNRAGRLDPTQVRRLKALEDRCHAVAGQVLRRTSGTPGSPGTPGTPGSPARAARITARDQAVLDAVWSMLAGVIFYFRNDPSFDAVAAQARRLILAAFFPDD
jgi:AcrR family transcriptional regulator